MNKAEHLRSAAGTRDLRCAAGTALPVNHSRGGMEGDRHCCFLALRGSDVHVPFSLMMLPVALPAP